VLCRTSNPGAGEFQDRLTEITAEEVSDLNLSRFVKTLNYEDVDGPATFNVRHYYAKHYQVVGARVAKHWNVNGNCAIVVGATYPEELRAVREIVGDMPILIPGIGAQGGDVEKTVTAGKRSDGRGMIINSSRGIIFASSGEDFAEAARRETLKLHEEILKYC